MKKQIKETLTTLDELKDETFGKVGTKKRDKFEKDSRKETKKDLQDVIDGKETLLDTDVITNPDLQGYSYEEMLDKTYGKKGTPTRIAAEKRIKEKAKTLLSDIKKKEAKENEEKKSLTKRLKKIKVKINYHHYKNGKKVKVTKGTMFINQDTVDALKGLKETSDNEAVFLKFAKEFSEKAEKSSAGDKIPNTYITNKGGFRIDYYVKIYEKKTRKFIPEPARISLITGVIEVSKTAFIKYTMPQRIKLLLSLYANWVNKNELNNGKPKKSTKQIKSAKVLVKRKAKAGNDNKVRKGKKNPVGQKNSKKRKGAK